MLLFASSVQSSHCQYSFSNLFTWSSKVLCIQQILLLQNIYISFIFIYMHSYATQFFITSETNFIGFKTRWYRGTCSALHPFSLSVLSIHAMTDISPFLAEKKITMQTLVFQTEYKCCCFCYRKVCIFNPAFRYKSVGISVTSSSTFCQ
jgi:hypothetical protein